MDRVSDSISSFPNVSAILSNLSKVETDVDTWKEWNLDEENPREEVPRYATPPSPHIMIPLYGQHIKILIRRVVVITPPHIIYRHNFTICHFCVFILFLRRWRVGTLNYLRGIPFGIYPWIRLFWIVGRLLLSPFSQLRLWGNSKHCRIT